MAGAIKNFIGEAVQTAPVIIAFEGFKALIGGAMGKLGEKGADQLVPFAMNWIRARNPDAEDENLYLQAVAAMEPNDRTRLFKKLDQLLHPTDKAISDFRMNWFRIIVLREDPADMVSVLTDVANLSQQDWDRMKRQMNLDREKAKVAFDRVWAIVGDERARLGTELAASGLPAQSESFKDKMKRKYENSKW